MNLKKITLIEIFTEGDTEEQKQYAFGTMETHVLKNLIESNKINNTDESNYQNYKITYTEINFKNNKEVKALFNTIKNHIFINDEHLFDFIAEADEHAFSNLLDVTGQVIDLLLEKEKGLKAKRENKRFNIYIPPTERTQRHRYNDKVNITEID